MHETGMNKGFAINSPSFRAVKWGYDSTATFGGFSDQRGFLENVYRLLIRLFNYSALMMMNAKAQKKEHTGELLYH